jgi:hypothetical protein
MQLKVYLPPQAIQGHVGMEMQGNAKQGKARKSKERHEKAKHGMTL